MEGFVGFVDHLDGFIRLTLLAYVVVACLIYAATLLCDSKNLPGAFRARLAKLSRKNRVLLIIAHPDDECMFFSPFILKRLKQRAKHPSKLFLLCMTNGDFDRLGKEREKELVESCCTLGIPECNIVILHHKDIRDDPHMVWDMEIVEEQLHRAVDKIRPDVIFTFDEFGVSGHKNHIAIHRAVDSILLDPGIRFQSVQEAYYLETVISIRKYLGILDLPLAALLSKNIFISNPLEFLQAQRAMVAHGSQLTWFRIAYIVASRYMLLNSFRVQKRNSPKTR